MIINKGEEQSPNCEGSGWGPKMGVKSELQVRKAILATAERMGWGCFELRVTATLLCSRHRSKYFALLTHLIL